MQTRLFWDTKMRLFYPPHISGPWHQNKWSVLSGHAAKTGDAARYLCNFWRLLHFSAAQCTHRLIGPWDGRVTHSERFCLALLPICNLPTALTPTLLSTRCEVRCRTTFIGEGAKRWRSEAAFDWRVRQSGAKRHRRHDRPVAFTTSCLCPCKRGTFSTVFVTCNWTSS